MFVRWQYRWRRKASWQRGAGDPDVHWAAVLVESRRVNGKPTQRHVAYLGGITESAIEHPAQRRWFWKRVTECLDSLQISPQERQRIEAAVAKRVQGPPTKEECDELDRRLAELTGDISTSLDKGDEAAAGSQERTCTFCGKPADQVKAMVTADHAAICNECINAAAKRIDELQTPAPSG